tara:strand:- start:633 stop:1271 length:639 start_codon:yes stop_codon:yes gene_type:complete
MIKSKNIVVFASGTGSNFTSIHKDIKGGKINGEIVLLITNNVNCKAVDFASTNGIKTSVINKNIMFDIAKYEDFLFRELKSAKADLIVLAGYLKMIPLNIISKYKNKILNIHPSLLPKFGGKGFYGMKVHRAVIESKETYTGATVHFVDEIYDNGPIIMQKKVEVLNGDTSDSIAKKVLDIEHKLFPYVVRKFCSDSIIFKDKTPIITGDVE